MKKILVALLTLIMLLGCFASAETPLAGGWTPSASPEITDELKALFDKAFEGFVGVNYVPVAYLGSQVAAGTNHCLLCQATVVYPGAQPYYALVYITQGLDGAASILSISEFNFGEFCEYGLVGE